jgi:WD40 repeat-containing protein SMU1
MNELLEYDVAQQLLTHTECLQQMKLHEPERYHRLQHITTTTTTKNEFDEVIAYQGTDREQRRALLAQSLQKEVRVVPSSRLLVLIGQALKFQAQEKRNDPNAEPVDIFGVKKGDSSLSGAGSLVTSDLHRTIKFGSKSYPTSACFSPHNGKYIITGSVDGFIEVYVYISYFNILDGTQKLVN